MDNSQRRELSRDLNRSSGGFELAFVAAIFGGIGLLIDRWLGTVPVFALGLFMLGIVGTVLKLWIGYDQQMRKLEGEGPWARRS
ncbi:MAG: AtpZ/AtpI family protein [Acidimicrobiia bacterium]